MGEAERVLSHDRMADAFDYVMNRYDLERRLQVLIDDFLGDCDLQSLYALDAGAGTGWGSCRLKGRGARVVSMDIGPRLVRLAASRCDTIGVVGDLLKVPFPNDTFDIVFSTEVIEHTPNPRQAVRELYRVLKPSGRLALSTPNKAWLWAVKLANHSGARPYTGLENFLWPGELRRELEQQGGTIIRHTGLHLFPFQLSLLHGLLRRLDRYGDKLLPLMINQCILVAKPPLQAGRRAA